jgi:putative tricarboxylic transport membrane protein
VIERGLNLLWVVLGLATMANAWALGLFGSMGPDSGLFPMICGVTITLCGLLLMIKKSTLVENPEWPASTGCRRILGVLGGLVGLTVTLPYLGFAISSALTTFVLLQTIERSRVLESVVLTLVSVLVIVYVFGHLLGMSLPRGPWGW